MDEAWAAKVIPFLLPAHATHLLQPMDVGVFQPAKQHHQNILVEQIRYGGGADYTKQDWLDAYREISIRTMKKHTLRSA